MFSLFSALTPTEQDALVPPLRVAGP